MRQSDTAPRRLPSSFAAKSPFSLTTYQHMGMCPRAGDSMARGVSIGGNGQRATSSKARGNRRRTDMGASQAAVAIATPSVLAAGDGGIPIGLIELELSLDGFSGNNVDFTSFVRTVADKAGGEFLFALPASDLIEDCLNIAVLRMSAADGDASILFACLDDQGRAVRIEHPSDTTRGLERFAESFVGVLERM
ncbi:hypothetical protein ACQKGL_07365 [Ensifer adhaerens]|uniref:hypothetical protein n=1 Tax=Ensifer adhaerens TaxID=106592 RepID=UPI003D02F8C8